MDAAQAILDVLDIGQQSGDLGVVGQGSQLPAQGQFVDRIAEAGQGVFPPALQDHPVEASTRIARARERCLANGAYLFQCRAQETAERPLQVSGLRAPGGP